MILYYTLIIIIIVRLSSLLIIYSITKREKNLLSLTIIIWEKCPSSSCSAECRECRVPSYKYRVASRLLFFIISFLLSPSWRDFDPLGPNSIQKILQFFTKKNKCSNFKINKFKFSLNHKFTSKNPRQFLLSRS